jgi:hypothetical protein
MRIRIDHLNIKNLSKKKTTTQTFLFSSKGIFRIKHKSVMRIKIIDGPVERLRTEGIELICDKSAMVDDEEWYQIPYDHVTMTITKEVHRLRPCALLCLCVERVNGELHDVYFETDESIMVVIEDIHAFLRLLQHSTK